LIYAGIVRDLTSPGLDSGPAVGGGNMRLLAKAFVLIICLSCLSAETASGQSTGQPGIRCARLSRGKTTKAKANKLTATVKKGLDGAFIQLWPEMLTQMNEAQWRQVLESMRAAGLRVIIVQYLRHNDTDLFPAPGKFDPTDLIMSYADGHPGTQIFLGLGYNTAWYTDWGNAEFLGSLARKNSALADTAWARYGSRHASFAGWYLPQEMWNENYTGEQVKNLRELYYAVVSRHCKGLAADKPVAVAPFFNPNPEFIGTTETPAQNAERFARLYAEFLTGSDIDIVMLQDSVGARKLEVPDFDAKVRPYFDAFNRLCAPKLKEFWADLEAYKLLPGDERRPAEPERFNKQVEMFAPLVKTAVAFDFFHYMNPHGHLKPTDYKQEQASLFKGYVREFVGTH
jgi:hypothetical protein